MTGTSDQENKRLVGILERMAVGALFLICTWQWNAHNKLEERVYNLQANSFSTDNARILEDRLMKNIDGIRLDVKNQTDSLRNEMNSKLDLLIKMQADKNSNKY